MNPMRSIKIEKVTLNFGAGKENVKLEKGVKLLRKLTGIEPVKTVTMKRIPTWGLRPGLPIGCKLTLRGAPAQEMLNRVLTARGHKLRDTQFDENGNIAFGIPEYIDVPGIKYDPELGILGFEVCVTLIRPGYRIKTRRIKMHKVPKRHRITKEEAQTFMTQQYKVQVVRKGDE
ncbi:50S ribosomal protein L5 [Candidatus Woesearchaeota archaeon]|nr:50S ribosomal protein L5 [Candidatus Woesearchaeota archaeon]